MKQLFYLFILCLLCSCAGTRTLNHHSIDKDFVRLNKTDSVSYSKFEVTNIQYRAFLDQHPTSDFYVNKELKVYSEAWVNEYGYAYNEPMQRNYFFHTVFDNFPVVNITFFAAKRYCEWLNAQLTADDHYYFRLPTKDEYQALLNSANIKYDSDNPDDYKNFKFNLKFEGNYPIDGSQYTAEANRKKSKWSFTKNNYEQNSMKVKHIIGNVHELLSNGHYIGGSWDSLPSEVQQEKKFERPLPTVGFRIVKVTRLK